MNPKFLLLALTIAGFTSCKTMYKSNQTPDDVYYSPVRGEVENTSKKNEEEDNRERYETAQNQDDNYLRMRVRDRRWSYLDDYDFYYDRNYTFNRFNYNYGYTYTPFGYNYNFGFSGNPSCYCNCYPSPLHPGVIVYNAKPVAPRRGNMGGYRNGGFNNNNNNFDPKSGNSNSGGRPVRGYNNSNGERYNNSNNSNSKGLGGLIRRVISSESPSSSGNNNNSNNNSQPVRSYNSSPSGGSSSGGSSGGGGGGGTVRPPRGRN
jgi:hypothetical protein